MGPWFTKAASLVVAGVLGCLGVLAGAPAPPQDTLWQKAVDCAARAEAAGVVPGTLEVKSSVRKPDGTGEAKSRMLFRIVYQGKESRTELVSATRDGKDVTADLQAEEAKQAQKDKRPEKEESASLELQPDYHPFSPESQDRLAVQRSGEAPLKGRRAVLFTFRETSKDGKSALVGKAWLDPETGEPLQVEVSPSPLPKHVDALSSTIRFETDTDGLWRIVTSETRGEGGMLWIRRVFESSFQFSDWHVKGGKQP